MLSDNEAGVGKDFVAFETMRKVDAGARIFLGSCLGMLEVWSSGLISARKPAPGTCNLSRPSARSHAAYLDNSFHL